MKSGIGSEFMEKTKYRFLGAPDQERGIPQPPLQTVHAKGEGISLPDPCDLELGTIGLRDAIEQRTSLRSYGPDSLSLDELSYLLWCTQGVLRVIPDRATFRTVPSAGARHPFETFVLANRVENVDAGLYQYLALEHGLRLLRSGADIAQQLVDACLGQAMVQESAATFFWVAERTRMTWRYGERGYRYLHLDAGHVCQNLYLAAESIGAGACAVGAFRDDEVNAVLDLDGTERFVVYLAPVGKRPAADTRE